MPEKNEISKTQQSITDILLSTPPEDLPNLCMAHSAFGQLCNNKRIVQRYKSKWKRTQRTQRDYSIKQLESLSYNVLMLFKDYLNSNELWILCSSSPSIFRHLCMDSMVQKNIADRLYQSEGNDLAELFSKLSGEQIVNLCEYQPSLKNKICYNDKLWKDILKIDISDLTLAKKETLLKANRETIMAQYKLLQIYNTNKRNISNLFDYLIKRGKKLAKQKPTLFKKNFNLLNQQLKGNNDTTIIIKGGKFTLFLLNGTSLITNEPRYNTQTKKVKLTLKNTRGVSDDDLSLKDLVFIKIGLINIPFSSFKLNRKDRGNE